MINFNIEDGNRMIKQNKIIIVTKRNNKTLFTVFTGIPDGYRMEGDNNYFVMG